MQKTQKFEKLKQVYLFSGASASGKTAVLRNLLPLLSSSGINVSICKIDCLHTEDDRIYRKIGIPCVVGLSGDICPDHFLVSNLPELWKWAEDNASDILFIETAGLCHRCSPATEKMVAGCVVDCTASSRTPGQLGPMLTESDFIVLTKTDMVSQAELEILTASISKLNEKASIFPVDAMAGYGMELLASFIRTNRQEMDFSGDKLRYTMPSAVCSYCVGEIRVGSAFQQGVVGKMIFEGKETE